MEINKPLVEAAIAAMQQLDDAERAMVVFTLEREGKRRYRRKTESSPNTPVQTTLGEDNADQRQTAE